MSIYTLISVAIHLSKQTIRSALGTQFSLFKHPTFLMRLFFIESAFHKTVSPETNRGAERRKEILQSILEQMDLKVSWFFEHNSSKASTFKQFPGLQTRKRRELKAKPKDSPLSKTDDISNKML